jgi:hypothetical protein
MYGVKKSVVKFYNRILKKKAVKLPIYGNLYQNSRI